MAQITRAPMALTLTLTPTLIVRVGVDLAKNVIQVHGVDAAGRRVVSRAIKRDQFLAWCAQLPAGWLWRCRPAQARTTGPASSRPTATPCG